MMRCPNCRKRGHIHRSKRRSSGERAMAWLALVRPFRCHNCNTRFWRLKFLPYKHRARGSRSRQRRRDGGSRSA